jgi:hypothetical protein
VRSYGILQSSVTVRNDGCRQITSSLLLVAVVRFHQCLIFLAVSVNLSNCRYDTNEVRKIKDIYKGDILHSSEFHNAAPWRGKRGIVVGTANTGKNVVCHWREY